MAATPDDIARRALHLLDLTELGDHATIAQVDDLCHRAHGRCGSVAAVCVWPHHVAQAVERLLGTSVRVATVVNFPTGDQPIDTVVLDTAQALADGTDEIDLVLPHRQLLLGNVTHPAAMLDFVRAAVPRDSHRLKVILETGVLDEPGHIERAAVLAIEHGADFLKTSTGKVGRGASLEATAVMLAAIRSADRPVGLKVSGGVRTLADATAYLEQVDEMMGPRWAQPDTFRFGASVLLDALEAMIERDDSTD